MAQSCPCHALIWGMFEWTGDGLFSLKLSCSRQWGLQFVLGQCQGREEHWFGTTWGQKGRARTSKHDISETHWCLIIQHRANNLPALPSPSGAVVAILFLLLLWQEPGKHELPQHRTPGLPQAPEMQIFIWAAACRNVSQAWDVPLWKVNHCEPDCSGTPATCTILFLLSPHSIGTEEILCSQKCFPVWKGVSSLFFCFSGLQNNV